MDHAKAGGFEPYKCSVGGDLITFPCAHGKDTYTFMSLRHSDHSETN